MELLGGLQAGLLRALPLVVWLLGLQFGFLSEPPLYRWCCGLFFLGGKIVESLADVLHVIVILAKKLVLSALFKQLEFALVYLFKEL